ncbi:uncharacterized protein LOC124615906 [Schistocerca americana]|uniref:uncharacterized protein LOC124615906 n=1 Tax=Schistocerca americana TaxID=7009 RepID=UPI001F4F47CF|nr:uncharacterized protein LOC124615906 [Schistocerca americana]
MPQLTLLRGWCRDSSVTSPIDSPIPRTPRPQQPPEGVITTPQDNPTEMEPSPPLVLLMELDPLTLQQPMPSTSGYWPLEVDAYPSGHFPGHVFTTANARFQGTTGSLMAPAVTASSHTPYTTAVRHFGSEECSGITTSTSAMMKYGRAERAVRHRQPIAR